LYEKDKPMNTNRRAGKNFFTAIYLVEEAKEIIIVAQKSLIGGLLRHLTPCRWLT